MKSWPIVFAGFSGAFMVAMGAYASHGPFDETGRAWLQTAVHYGLAHTIVLVALYAIAQRAKPSRLLTAVSIAFAAGILLFSGTLFLRVLFEWAWVSKATPLGGMSFIAGWLLLAAYGVVGQVNRP